MPTTTTATTTATIRRFGLGAREIPYDEGMDEQRRVHALVRSGDSPPTILLLEHEAVFTAGKRTQTADIGQTATPVLETDRGGRITWHGPGQLVAYPIVPLPHPLDVVAYVRTLEAAMIETCAAFGVSTVRVPGRSGVWCEPSDARPWRKVGAIGVRVAGGVTMHGLSLNVTCDLAWAREIVPCGITDADVTNLALEGATEATVTDVADVLETCLVRNLAEYLAGNDPTRAESIHTEPSPAEPPRGAN